MIKILTPYDYAYHYVTHTTKKRSRESSANMNQRDNSIQVLKQKPRFKAAEFFDWNIEENLYQYCSV